MTDDTAANTYPNERRCAIACRTVRHCEPQEFHVLYGSRWYDGWNKLVMFLLYAFFCAVYVFSRPH